jgi:predicted alpha/beta superfamily hydrolase
MEKESILIADRTCTIYKSGQPDYLLVQPIDEHDLEVLDNEVETILSLTDKPFTLVAFEIKDWQSELTPWTAPVAFGKIPFGDGADTTLRYVKENLIPTLEQMCLYDKGAMQSLFGGYSLAGFFALWAGYQSPVFNGIAAVSPSVWYPQWMDYAETHKPQTTAVYLSLGDKEEKTKNPVMAQVGNCIRKQHELLTAHSINTILEWNPGNHFQHSDERTAKGFAWLMNLCHSD